MWKSYTFAGCRRYGIPLVDNLCDLCYSYRIGPRSFQPENLPLAIVEGKGPRTDARRTYKELRENDRFSSRTGRSSYRRHA